MATLVKFQEDVLDAVSRVEQPVVRFAAETAVVVARRVAELPRLDLPRVDLKRFELPRFELPEIDLPRPAVLETQLEFARRFVDGRREFVRELGDAVRPVVVAVRPAQPLKDVIVDTTTAKKPAAKKPAAKKPAAKKPAAKKPAA
jgi:hypothetical protein